MQTIGPLARAWVVWGVVAALVLGYYALWAIATEAPKAAVVLRPGAIAQLEVTSILGHAVGFEVRFHHEPTENREAELGRYRWLNGTPGKRIFPNPGEALKINISVNGGPPLRLEAMPAGAWSETEIARTLTPNHSVAFGEWQWPSPQSARLTVARGRNKISFEIADVGPSLVGERVTLVADPPLSFKSGQNDYRWLWYAWLLCPIGAVCLAITWLPLVWRTVNAIRGRAE
ncbi:hypothetical protein F4827_003268 [Paraburkholderia bannensis]|uniref:Uncharacterized protein n=1 Tax=Paraburkholderia bannensis TaxID=765414 RepID=A0A7W9TXU6_9BURK|nr:hypothetical protein [Paraburkholderia sp. WP4_3_2]MBB6103413.1 hypothetical protein [Paraburkholderia bannensis]